MAKRSGTSVTSVSSETSIPVRMEREGFFLARFAAAFWVLSLVVPLMPPVNSVAVYGYKALIALMNPFAILFGGIPMLAPYTNFIFFSQLSRVVRGGRGGKPVAQPHWIVMAFFFNFIAIAFATAKEGVAPGLHARPAAYLWMLSFLLLLVAILRGEGLKSLNETASSIPSSPPGSA